MQNEVIKLTYTRMAMENIKLSIMRDRETCLKRQAGAESRERTIGRLRSVVVGNVLVKGIGLCVTECQS